MVAVPAKSGDEFRVMFVCHFPLRGDSIILDFDGVLVCMSIKSLLSMLVAAGLSVFEVFFADSLPRPARADSPLTAST